MKKIIFTSFLIILINFNPVFSKTDLSNLSETIKTEATETKELVFNLLKEEKEDSEIVLKLEKDTSFVIVNQNETWTKISTENTTGYIKTEDLFNFFGMKNNTDSKTDSSNVSKTSKNSSSSETDNSENNSDNDVPDIPTEPGLKGIPVKNSYTEPVHLRRSATLNSDCPVIIPVGGTVNLLAVRGKWCKVEYEGNIGYVRTYYVGDPDSSTLTDIDTDSTNKNNDNSTVSTGTDESKTTSTATDNKNINQEPLPFDLSKVKWLHTNVSSWPVTSKLKPVRLGSSTITLDYDKTSVWPGKDTVGAFVNANPWIFIQKDGVWYAATFEWMRHGQTTKGRKAVKGDHIKQSPFQNFTPQSGTTYYFMVSGLARSSVRNVKERTNIVKFIWP